MLVCAVGAACGSATGLSATKYGYDSPLPFSGVARTSAAFSTPGTWRISSSVRVNISAIIASFVDLAGGSEQQYGRVESNVALNGDARRKLGSECDDAPFCQRDA